MLHGHRDLVLFTARIKSQRCQLLCNLALVKLLSSLRFHRVILITKCTYNKVALGTVPGIF